MSSNLQNKRDIARTVLIKLYEAWEGYHLHFSLESLLNESEWSETLFETIIKALEEERGYIKSYAQYYTFDITVDGILYAEENSLISADKVAIHNGARQHILNFLTDFYEEEGVHSHAHYTKICENAPLDELKMLIEISFLKDLGYIRAVSTSSYSITIDGLRFYKGVDYTEDII